MFEGVAIAGHKMVLLQYPVVGSPLSGGDDGGSCGGGRAKCFQCCYCSWTARAWGDATCRSGRFDVCAAMQVLSADGRGEAPSKPVVAQIEAGLGEGVVAIHCGVVIRADVGKEKQHSMPRRYTHKVGDESRWVWRLGAGDFCRRLLLLSGRMSAEKRGSW